MLNLYTLMHRRPWENGCKSYRSILASYKNQQVVEAALRVVLDAISDSRNLAHIDLLRKCGELSLDGICIWYPYMGLLPYHIDLSAINYFV